MNTNLKKHAVELLKHAGISINGNNPWDIQIHNPNLYQRVRVPT